jgi:integrase
MPAKSGVETGFAFMPLTTKRVAKLTTKGRYADGHGLYLQVMTPSNRSWLFRYSRDGREKFMGLGPLHAFDLAEARERARKARQQLADGVDPIADRRAQREAKRAAEAAVVTFKQAAEQFIELYADGWRNAKHRAQWRSTLESYAFPSLGNRPVETIDNALINATLAPVWSDKAATAGRVRNRIERVLKWVRDGRPLPTFKASEKSHHPALAYGDLPEFMAELRSRTGVAVAALEFTILTAARTGETLGAKWSEIDLANRLWIISAERMKSGKAHRVPLSDRAVEILETLPREARNDYLFVGTQAGKPIANSQMLKLLRGMRPGVVVHGFRASFSTWCREATAIANDIIESSLAHTNPNKTELAYSRGDLLDKRRRLMTEWAKFCSSPAREGADVISIRQR